MGGLNWAALDWVIEVLGIEDVEGLIGDLVVLRDKS